MTVEISAKDKLTNLLKALLRVHKSLLGSQKTAYEKSTGSNLTAYDAWQLSVSHPDFAWLRLISALIIALDEASDDKELAPEETYKKFSAEISAILNASADQPDFKQKLEAALAQSPELCLEVADLKRQIEVASAAS